MSPELFMSSEIASEFSKSPAIDIFALGATLFCMVVGNPPWMANNQIDLAYAITNMELVFPDDIILDPHLKVLYFILSYFILSYFILSYIILFYFILSYFILSFFILSYLM